MQSSSPGPETPSASPSAWLRLVESMTTTCQNVFGPGEKTQGAHASERLLQAPSRREGPSADPQRTGEGVCLGGRDQVATHQTACSVFLTWEGEGGTTARRSGRALAARTPRSKSCLHDPPGLRPLANLTTSPCLSFLVCKMG